MWSQCKFPFQAFAVLFRSVPCRVMILAHASVLRVCDQIHMRETWDAPRGPQTALCRCFPILLPSQWSPQYFQFLRTLLFSLLSILGLYCSTLCILPAAVTVKSCRKTDLKGVQWTHVPPSSGSAPSAGGERCPSLAFRYLGALLLPWSLPLWDDLGAGTQKERWKNAYFSLSCS